MEAKLIKGQFSLSQNCAMMKLQNNKFDIQFAFHFITQLFYEERKIIPTIMQPSLRIDDLNKFIALLPPLKEQTEIANYLDFKTLTIDRIVTSINRQIATLKELRKTLINDVVTGKIKVS
jgi:type I restriction enzyme S subunit